MTDPAAVPEETMTETFATFFADVAQWITTSSGALIVSAAAAVLFAVFWTLRFILRRAVGAAGGDQEGSRLFLLHGMAQRIGVLFLFILSLKIAVTFAETPGQLTRVVDALFVISAVIQVASLARYVVLTLIEQYVKSSPERTRELQNAHGLIRVLITIAISVVSVVVILENLGVNVSALMAGLGIGGIAIGLAAQGVFRDLFSSMSIILDKPFQTGDFIIAGTTMGTVERIGLQNTRIRSLSGEQLVVSNTDLVSSRVQNYKRMFERRVVFSIGVTYETPYEKLAGIPDMIKRIVLAQNKTRFDRCHFARYGDFALQFETVYHVLSKEYIDYMDIQQAINFAIFEAFEREGIVFAYPTQTVHLASAPMAASGQAVPPAQGGPIETRPGPPVETGYGYPNGES